MEETEQEVLFEIHSHASRPYSSYPPEQKLNEGGRWSSFPYLPFLGISRLKEKWSEYRQVRRMRRLVSLFVSARGDYVAVASGNQITVLQKDNDYKEPTGTFKCPNPGTFTCGAWSESHELLGVADDSDKIYILKSNGEEVTRITRRHLNVSSQILGLIARDEEDENKGCTFSIFLSDGSFHDIEICKDPSNSVLSTQSSKNVKVPREFSQDLCCWDYHPKLSLFVVVSDAGEVRSNERTGSCTVSVWNRRNNLQLEPVVFANFEGSYSVTKRDSGQLTSSKVLFSPLGNFVATLDTEGCLFAFKFDKEKCLFSKCLYDKRYNSKSITDISSSGAEFLPDIFDFTWWSEGILTVAKRDGSITMVGITNYVNILEKNLVYSTPILERVQQSSGFIFILESTSFEEKFASLIEHVTTGKTNQFDFSNLKWSLVSLTKRSVLEIYDKLIRSQSYQAAFDFAEQHGLDKDDLLKSQWLSSVQGVHEINTILRLIKDQSFVLSECVEKVGPTEDAMRNLLSFGLSLTESYRFSDLEDNEDSEIWNLRLARLKLLQFRDKLETFIGINMGRFSVQDYGRFREFPISKAALALAENGKIGALNLLFKRHPYSLIFSMLEILAAIPETIPVQSYGQLLPGVSAPASVFVRDEDWVECEKMLLFVNKFHVNCDSNGQIMTEPMLMKCPSYQWPSVSKLSSWYKKRARDMDALSGQLDNCMCLVDMAIRKGICDLQPFLDDVFYLNQLIYSDEDEVNINFSMSLANWEELSDYDKFKLILLNATEENVIPRLHKKAIPFMRKRLCASAALSGDDNIGDPIYADSFLVRWLKEVATKNKLEICLVIFEEGCKDLENSHFFRDGVELVDCALQCIYSCADMDRWSSMFAILSKLPPARDIQSEDIKQRLKLAEGHVEAGRLLAQYQVPKPISFFLDVHLDVKGVKQILRLLLSKFSRSQPGRTDLDWANMWHDLQSLQEKAFPFLDLEYMLIEFCRGLLKAGKFSLARSYVKGTSSVALATDKAESLVIQAAREYFFSAPSLACSEIWKAKECLNIFPSSRNVRAEADIIDAVTVRLPNLGVNLLPMAFKQIKDPMEIIKLAISSQSGAYLNVDEIIEIAKLLGLNSQEEISKVQEVIAREAAFAGDVQLAFDLCLLLAKKDHGPVWDLCAALARSQALESMDSKSQKLLLGFASCHCDEESIGELLNEWNNLDMVDQCGTLITLSGKEPSGVPEQSLPKLGEFLGRVDFSPEDQKVQLTELKCLLSLIAQNLSKENENEWESLLSENTKVASFASLWLPWLLELSEDEKLGQKLSLGSVSSIPHVTVKRRAVMALLSWLTSNGFVPRDHLVASLAKSFMEPPVSVGEDVIGCSVLLNLVDAFHGVEIIEEQLRMRRNYQDFSSLMNVGMIYGLLHDYGIECESPDQRRKLVLNKFQEKHNSASSDEYYYVHDTQPTFWNEWKIKLEQQKHVAEKTRILEKVIPGLQTTRFFSGDMEYIESVVFSLIESVRWEKKKIIKDAIAVADTYGLDHKKVVLYYLSTILVSEVWSFDDIMEEISDLKDEIFACAGEAIETISSSVYPLVDGYDKEKLAFIYSLLHDCYVRLAESEELAVAIDQDLVKTTASWHARFCKFVAEECCKISFIKGLNFKNLAGLHDLNMDCFNGEVCAQINADNVDALAKMVENLVLVYGGKPPEGLLSGKYVYTHYILSSLAVLEGKAERETRFRSSQDIYFFVDEMEQIYGTIKGYIQLMKYPDVFDILKRLFTCILPINEHLRSFPHDTTGKECLVKLVNFWIGLMNEVELLVSRGVSGQRFCSNCSITCLVVFSDLLTKGTVSPKQGWTTLVHFVDYGLECNGAVEIFNFCRAMIFSGCGFEAVSHVFSEAVGQLPTGSTFIATTQKLSVDIQDLAKLYLSIMENVLHDIASGSPERVSLHYLLSSLSKLEGDLEDLMKVRHAVWERMSMFSDNLRIQNHLRVYALELMQFLSGRKRNLEVGPADLLPWEGWDDFSDRNADVENTGNELSSKDASNRFTNTLVALKSSQLISSISPSLQITSEDIVSVDSAVSCILRISDSTTTVLHMETLSALLGEWEGIFMTGTGDSEEVSDPMNNWSSDGWDEGWESFQEESSDKEIKKSKDFSIHPLHICWSTIIRKLLAFSDQRKILKLLDQHAVKHSVILLDEDDARSLSKTAIEADCFLALKIALLLPYEAIQLQCLDAVENKLKERGVADDLSQDHFLFVLVLSSGIISIILTGDSYGATFSFLCLMVGKFCRQFQEMEASRNHVGSVDSENKEESPHLLFTKLMFPCFLAELVKADQHILAGFLVTRFMHTNASLSLINISEDCLRIFLERQCQELGVRADMSYFEPLANSITDLRGKFGNLIQSALALLPTNVR